MSGPAPPILEIENVSKAFTVGRHLFKAPTALRALVDISLSVPTGQALGIVGESGSGKTTLARTIVGLIEPDKGRILLAGQDLAGLSGSALRAASMGIQMVFQDPASSLNPRMRVGDAIDEPLLIHRIVPGCEVANERNALLERVGLSTRLADRLPRELSGGQRQRVSIARALAVRPRILLADEAVSALDVSVRAQILNLLHDLRDELALTLVFISHDLSVIDHLSDRVAVMYFGRLVEYGPTSEVFAAAAHPYTRALVAAIPQPTVGMTRLEPALTGEQPSAMQPISGCVFRSRCPMAQAVCAETPPPNLTVSPSHWAACHFAPQVAAQKELR